MKNVFKSNTEIVLSTNLGTRSTEPILGNEFSEESIQFLNILKKINAHFDTQYSQSVTNNVTSFLDKFYFRSKFVGLENGVPERNDPNHPLIFISNHSGMGFPWDGIIMASMYAKKTKYNYQKAMRALVAPMLSQSIYMEPYMIENFWKRMGGVDATLENFEALMHTNDTNVLIYPEGVLGIGKGFNHKYELQNLSSSFIRMALKFKIDIIPIATINGEYLNPYSYKSDEVNKLANKLKIPFLPIGPLSFVPAIYPWGFYFCMPAKLTYIFGKPIKLYEILDTPFHKVKKKDINHLREVVRGILQDQILAGLEIYGKDPYELEELGDLWRDNLDKIFYIMPSGWPILFSEHERLFLESGMDTSMSYDNLDFGAALSQNLSQLPFITPFVGWPILLKSRGIL